MYAQKASFSTNQSKFNNVFADSLAKFSRIFQSFPVLDDVLLYLMKLREISVLKFSENSVLIFYLIQFCCILSTFAFDDFKSLQQTFRLIRTGGPGKTT